MLAMLIGSSKKTTEYNQQRNKINQTSSTIKNALKSTQVTQAKLGRHKSLDLKNSLDLKYFSCLLCMLL